MQVKTGSLLVRICRPLGAWYQTSGIHSAFSALGKWSKQSFIHKGMSRVAAKGFYTETSLTYRALGAVRKRFDRMADALHNGLRKPALQSASHRASTSVYRSASSNGVAAAGFLLIGCGVGFGIVSAIRGSIVIGLAAAAGGAALGALLYALRRYLAAHAKNSLLVRLFAYLLHGGTAQAAKHNQEGG